MADGLRDIVIKIKAELNDKEYKKSMQELADNSATALEKSYRKLEDTIYKQMRSFNDMAENTFKTTDDPFGLSLHGEWLADMDKYIEKFRTWQAEIRNTGFLPKDTDTKLYQSYSNVVKLYEAYQSAVREEERLNAELQKTAPEITVVRENVIKAALQVNKLESEFNTVVNDIEILSKLDAMPKIDPSKLKRYETITNTIQNLKAQSRQLYEEAFSYEKNSEQQNATLAKRAEIEAKIANQERALKTIGKDTLALIQQIKSLEAQLTFRGGVEGLEKLKKKSDELSEKLEKAKEKHQSLLTEESTVTEQRDVDFSAYEQAQQHVDDLETELVIAMHRTEELDGAAKKTGHSFNQWRNVVWSVSRLLGNVYTIGLDLARGARQIANFYMKMWNAAKKVLAIFKKLRESVKKTSSEHAKSWKQMLKDVFRYSLGIRSLFMLFRRLRGYIKEAFQAMAEQIPEVNARLSELKSSFNALKGSLATALEPALAALARSLVTIIDLLAKALTYVGMFIAALSGRGYVYQAQKVATSFADAAGSAKELNKQLQGFDELNNLTTNQGGGGGADSPLAQFEKVDVPDWIKNLAEMLKNAWEQFIGPIKAAWSKLGDEVVAAWKRAFSNVSGLLLDIARDFLKVWNDGLGESIASHILLIVRDIGNIIANLAEKIREAWNAVEEGYDKSNGIRFWEAILTMIDKVLAGIQKITEDMAEWIKTLDLSPAMSAFVGWLESLVPIVEMVMEILFQFWDRAMKPILTWAFDGENSGVARFFRILQDFNDKLDKEKIINDLNKIWDALGRFGQNVGEGLLIFMERMADKIANWLNSDNFTKWCEDVAAWLDSLDPEELADDLEQVVTIIQNIAKELWNAIKFVLDHKDQILDALEWASTHLKEIAAVFLGGKLAIDIARFVANIALAAGAFSKMFAGVEGGTTIFSALAGVLSGPVLVAIGAVAAAIGALVFAYGGVEGVIEKIKETATNVINNLKKKADELGITEKIEKLKTAFDKLKVTLEPVIELLRAGLKFALDIVFKRIEEIVTFIGSEVLNIINALVTMLTGVIDFINGFVTVIKGAVEIIVGLFTGDLDKARQGAENIWNGIKDIFKGSIEFVVGLFKGFVDLILEPFKQIKYQLIGDPIVIDMWDGIKKVFEDSIGKIIEFVKNLKEKVIQFFTDLKNKLAEKAEEIWQKLLGIAQKFTDIKEKITNVLMTLVSTVVSKIASIKDKFDEFKSNMETVKSSISTTLDSLKTTFVETFDKIKEGIKTPINAILGFVEKLVNGVVDGFNAFGEKLGDFNFDIPDALAEKFDLPKEFKLSIPKLTKVNIPRLAQGAVIPPNKEFLAVLGDQKRGTNIETPLNTMVEAFNMANKGGNEQEIELLQEQNNLLRQLLQKEFGITEGDVFRSVVNQNSIYKKSTGISAFI